MMDTQKSRCSNLQVLSWLLLCIILTCCAPGAGAASELAFLRIEPVSQFGEAPYLIVEASHGQDWIPAKPQLTVDGKEAFWERIGGGFSSGRSFESFLLYVGSPGPKLIALSAQAPDGPVRIETRYDFQSAGGLLLLDHYDGETFFAPFRLQIYSYFLNDLRLRLNDRPIGFKMEARPEGFELVSCEPGFQPGRNRLSVTARDARDREFEKTFLLYFLRDNKIKVGEEVGIGYGLVGTRSGPFYRLEVGGTALVPGSAVETVRHPELRRERWLAERERLVRKVRAFRSGVDTITVYKKERFTDEFQVEWKRQITVTD